jgi:hypothetical protein
LWGVPEIAKARTWGVRESLHWLSIMDIENATIEIESDRLQVVQSINGECTNYSKLGSIVDMCRWMFVTNNN